MREKKDIKMSHFGHKWLKNRIFGKTTFVIEGNPSICHRCGTKLNESNYRFLKGYNYCGSCYKELTGLNNQFDISKFTEFLYRNATKNHGHLDNLDDRCKRCIKNANEKHTVQKNKKDSRVKL